MTRIVAIVNQKGGVGKTTSAINLGAALGALERQVLLVDCDPQGNATRGLGVEATKPNLYDVLSDSATARAAIRPSGFPHLDIIPSDRELVGVEVEFVGQSGWERWLKEALDPVVRHYDEVLLDCPPSLGHLTVSALVAATEAFVPIQCEYFALEGVSALVATLTRVRQRLNPHLGIGGVLLTMYDERTNLSKDVVNEIRNHFKGQVFDTVVPRNVRLAEAPSHGQSVLEYAIKSSGAQAYLAVAEEYLRRVAA